jgi:negative regulator of flagellin synthesis FlgM
VTQAPAASADLGPAAIRQTGQKILSVTKVLRQPADNSIVEGFPMTGLSDLRNIFSNHGSTATTSASQTGKTNGASQAGVTDGGGKAASTSFRGIDQSAISLTAQTLSGASNDSDVRMEKVQQLQAAIANGAYNVSASAVADKLIQSMLGQ